jgi:TIR domain
MPDLLYRPKIFISHSAKEPEARALCKALAGYLASKFDVLWDDNLQTAQVWRAAIDEWIWKCDAAVLVLSKAATKSRYVAYEAAHLRQRWIHMRPCFTLVPVWCPDVNEQILLKNMGALQLQEIHTNVKLRPPWPPKATTDSAAFDHTVRQVESALQIVREQGRSRPEIEDLLIKELNLGTSNELALTTIADAYELPPLPAGAKHDRANLARLLLDPVEKLDGSLTHNSARNRLPGRIQSFERDGSMIRVGLDCGFPLKALITQSGLPGDGSTGGRQSHGQGLRPGHNRGANL